MSWSSYRTAPPKNIDGLYIRGTRIGNKYGVNMTNPSHMFKPTDLYVEINYYGTNYTFNGYTNENLYDLYLKSNCDIHFSNMDGFTYSNQPVIFTVYSVFKANNTYIMEQNDVIYEADILAYIKEFVNSTETKKNIYRKILLRKIMIFGVEYLIIFNLNTCQIMYTQTSNVKNIYRLHDDIYNKKMGTLIFDSNHINQNSYRYKMLNNSNIISNIVGAFSHISVNPWYKNLFNGNNGNMPYFHKNMSIIHTLSKYIKHGYENTIDNDEIQQNNLLLNMKSNTDINNNLNNITFAQTTITTPLLDAPNDLYDPTKIYAGIHGNNLKINSYKLIEQIKNIKNQNFILDTYEWLKNSNNHNNIYQLIDILDLLKTEYKKSTIEQLFSDNLNNIYIPYNNNHFNNLSNTEDKKKNIILDFLRDIKSYFTKMQKIQTYIYILHKKLIKIYNNNNINSDYNTTSHNSNSSHIYQLIIYQHTISKVNKIIDEVNSSFTISNNNYLKINTVSGDRFLNNISKNTFNFNAILDFTTSIIGSNDDIIFSSINISRKVEVRNTIKNIFNSTGGLKTINTYSLGLNTPETITIGAYKLSYYKCHFNYNKNTIAFIIFPILIFEYNGKKYTFVYPTNNIDHRYIYCGYHDGAIFNPINTRDDILDVATNVFKNSNNVQINSNSDDTTFMKSLLNSIETVPNNFNSEYLINKLYNIILNSNENTFTQNTNFRSLIELYYLNSQKMGMRKTLNNKILTNYTFKNTVYNFSTTITKLTDYQTNIVKYNKKSNIKRIPFINFIATDILLLLITNSNKFLIHSLNTYIEQFKKFYLDIGKATEYYEKLLDDNKENIDNIDIKNGITDFFDKIKGGVNNTEPTQVTKRIIGLRKDRSKFKRKYNELNSEYNEITDDYDELLDEYKKADRKLTNTTYDDLTEILQKYHTKIYKECLDKNIPTDTEKLIGIYNKMIKTFNFHKEYLKKILIRYYFVKELGNTEMQNIINRLIEYKTYLNDNIIKVFFNNIDLNTVDINEYYLQILLDDNDDDVKNMIRNFLVEILDILINIIDIILKIGFDQTLTQFEHYMNNCKALSSLINNDNTYKTTFDDVPANKQSLKIELVNFVL